MYPTAMYGPWSSWPVMSYPVWLVLVI